MTNSIDASTLLHHMKAMAEQAQQPEAQQADGQVSFSKVLEQSIDTVNEIQKESANTATQHILGNPDVSVADVMIAKEKSGIAFQSLMQVRNRLVEAYKEIMNMSI